jgi:hypothetical protein
MNLNRPYEPAYVAAYFYLRPESNKLSRIKHLELRHNTYIQLEASVTRHPTHRYQSFKLSLTTVKIRLRTFIFIS